MTGLIAVLLSCAGGGILWASLDRPIDAPDWHGVFGGVSYSPSGIYSETQLADGVSEATLRNDLEQLGRLTPRIRTYTTDRGQDRIPYIAKELGLTISLGIWLGNDRGRNEIEIAKATTAIWDNPGVVDRVFVGNETVLRGELTVDDLTHYIRRVKQVLPQHLEVGTAETWNIWLDHPALAEASDFVGIHILPYWEGLAAQHAAEYIAGRVSSVQERFPHKKVVIAEAGWPSNGRVRRSAVPSTAWQSYFLRQFLTLADTKNYDYYIIEAFDQPWKAKTEGAVGAFWGVWDADRQAKLTLSGPLTTFARWPAYAGAAMVATLVLGVPLVMLVPAMAASGYVLIAAVLGLLVNGALFALDAVNLRYVDSGTLATALLVAPALLFAAILMMTEAVEWALSLWRLHRTAAPSSPIGRWPKVSIHVPTHNEPAVMVMQTLNALARLDYPDFEVIVLDNNTRDAGMWRPVENHCRRLGPQFRFYHFDAITGFKAGALNKALELTHVDAEYVAVLDSDYQVEPDWIKSVLPAFSDAAVALVQAPQDYRDAEGSLFKRASYEEYATFFHVGMVERNEHNAIIQHGTLCVMRRSALAAVGGWAEWCITEDTELGLRFFEAGYQAVYTPAAFGRGLMPDSFDAYKDQRYRWVYGAMQIMKRHVRAIFTTDSRLARAQRYHFVAGWLPWIADAFGLVFAVCALVWTALVTLAPQHFDVPLTAFSAVAVAWFCLKTLKSISLHRSKLGSGWLAAMAAVVMGLSLGYTVAKGVIAGAFTSSQPFLRTPKCEGAAQWVRVWRVARAEAMLATASVMALAAHLRAGVADPAEIAWCAVLFVMAAPYASALVVAIGATVQLTPQHVLSTCRNFVQTSRTNLGVAAAFRRAGVAADRDSART